MESPWTDCADSLREALSKAATFPISCLSGREALVCLSDLQALRSSLEALICRAMAEAGSCELVAGETGQRSVAGVVAAETGSNPRSLRADQRLGAWVDGYPLLGEAFAQGRITRDHVHAIRARENPRTRRYLPAAQEDLIEAAVTLSWSEFLIVLRYWDLAADPDGEEPEEQVEARGLHYRKHTDGTVTGGFTLDPLAGHAFVTALERKAQHLFRHDTESGSLRTIGQRRADALLELLATSGSHQPESPLVHVVMSEQVAATHLDAVANDETPDQLPIDAMSLDRRCESIDGTPIHPNFAIATMATAGFRRLVMKPDGECTDLGRRARGFPPRLKAALLVRARGRCEHPACDAPVSWLQADHLIPWSRNGPTSLANGQILCDPHNKQKRDALPSPSPRPPAPPSEQDGPDR